VTVQPGQALRGQSIVAPDAVTLTAAGARAGSAALATGAIILHALLTAGRPPVADTALQRARQDRLGDRLHRWQHGDDEDDRH
jgi:hypothetical protein